MTTVVGWIMISINISISIIMSCHGTTINIILVIISTILSTTTSAIWNVRIHHMTERRRFT